MNKWLSIVRLKEEGIKKWISEHIMIIVLVCATILSLVIRIDNIDVISIDMEQSLLDWYGKMVENNRVYGLYHQIGNYNIPYQAIIMLMTYIPINPVWQFKIVSIAFDYILAILSAYLGYVLFEDKFSKEKKQLFAGIIYIIMLFLPSVIVNSSIWGQCDSIYVAFIVASIICLKLNKNFWSFVLLGLGFSFKMQALFIVPFYIMYIFACKDRYISIFNLVLIPLTDWIVCLPVMIKRNNLLETFQIYFGQMGEYKDMYLNFPSFWQFVGGNYDVLKTIAVVTTIMILGIVFLMILKEKIDLGDNEMFIAGACWSVWTVVEFLPSMHERYGYTLIPLVLILCFVNKSFAIPNILLQFVYICIYSDYVFWNGCNYFIMSVLHLLGYIWLTWGFVKLIIMRKES